MDVIIAGGPGNDAPLDVTAYKVGGGFWGDAYQFSYLGDDGNYYVGEFTVPTIDCLSMIAGTYDGGVYPTTIVQLPTP